jgi:hypothetical protein
MRKKRRSDLTQDSRVGQNLNSSGRQGQRWAWFARPIERLRLEPIVYVEPSPIARVSYRKIFSVPIVDGATRKYYHPLNLNSVFGLVGPGPALGKVGNSVRPIET